jgi:hypothetical protein
MPYCFNCNAYEENMPSVCSDCSVSLCSNCEIDDDVLCGCYGTCDSCDCEINRGSHGRKCMDCQEWLCYSCREKSNCPRCGNRSSSHEDSDSDNYYYIDDDNNDNNSYNDDNQADNDNDDEEINNTADDNREWKCNDCKNSPSRTCNTCGRKGKDSDDETCHETNIANDVDDYDVDTHNDIMKIDPYAYKVIHLSNGNILLRLKKDIDNRPYNLVITDISFYKACKNNMEKIHMYQPTNLTKQLLKIIIDETMDITTIDNLYEKINWIQENLTSHELDLNKFSLIKKMKCDLVNIYINIKINIEFYNKNNELKLQTSTLVYVFIKFIAELSGHNYGFGEEFFLLKLIHQYFPDIIFDYSQIYNLETKNDLDMCKEKGSHYYNLVISLCQGDKKAFLGNEIEFFPSSFERNKMSISEEIFSCIEDDIYDDGINYKNYEPTDPNY